VPIHAFTTYDLPAYRKFVRFNLNRGRFYRAAPWLFCSLICLGLLICLIDVFTFGFDEVTLLFLVLEGVLLLLYGFLYLALPRISFRAARKTAALVNEYLFGEESVSLRCKTDGLESSATVRYDAFYKIYETRDFFYLYLTKHSAYLVRKSEIEGNPLLISSAIARRVSPKQFVFCG